MKNLHIKLCPSVTRTRTTGLSTIALLVPHTGGSGWGLLTTDTWPYFLLTTDFWPKIFLTTDFFAVEFND